MREFNFLEKKSNANTSRRVSLIGSSAQLLEEINGGSKTR